MFNRIIALIKKELLAVWQDKRSRMILIGPPLMQLVIFAFAATLEVKNVSIGIINEDRGSVSQDIIENFQGSRTFNKIYYLDNIEEARDFINTQKGLAVLYFKSDFSRKVQGRRTSEIQLILDGRKSNAAQIVQGYIIQIINQYSIDLNRQNNIAGPKSMVITRNWYNANLEYIWFTVPGLLGILVLMISLIVTSLSVARERELGTFDQLLVSPIMPLEILIGKLVPGIIIGMIEGTLLILAAIFIFKIPFTGSIWLLYLSIFVFLLSGIGFGLFISSLCKTQQQAILGAFLFSSPAIVLSGFASPIENMPDWLQPLTAINPLKYFLIISRGLFLKDMSLEFVLANLWPMLIIAIVTLAGATWFFRRRLE